MAQYIITQTFADDTWFKEWLTPSVFIRQWDDVNLQFNDIWTFDMLDKWQWEYVYVFYNYDKSKLYSFKIDWWSDDLVSRYSAGNNELDYYSNKEDWWSIFRWYTMNLDTNITKSVVKAITEELKKITPKDIDLSEIISKLNDIDKKEYPEIDTSEISDMLVKLYDKDVSSDILSQIQNYTAKMQKSNDDNRVFISELLQQIQKDTNIINDLKEYIQKIMLRWDVENDSDFKRLMKKIDKDRKLIEELELESDDDFISLLEEWQ